MTARIWILLAGLLGASAVGMGAFHAHGLEEWLTAKMQSEEEVAKWMHFADVAISYQMYNALALLGVGILAARRQRWLLSAAAAAILLGVIGFSGGLYCSVFDLVKLPPMVVPIGGLLMIVGWVLVAAGAFVVDVDRDEK